LFDDDVQDAFDETTDEVVEVDGDEVDVDIDDSDESE
jgi:hypothetical protein